MTPHSPATFRFARFLLLTVGALLLSSTVYAVPPAAPSNVKGYMSKRTAGTDRLTYWHISWQDNALDESGYLVRGRVLHRGTPVTPYYDWASEPANSTAAIIVLGDVDPIYTLQFQVIAYKQNGNRMETRAGTNQAVVRIPTTSNWLAPTNLIMENVNDGAIKARWTDNSDTEIRFELLVRKTGTTPWLLAADPLLGQTELVMEFGFEPNTAYEWAVRALRFNALGNLADRLPLEANLVAVPLTTPVLTPPTNLVATIVGEGTVGLTWEDNSVNAMGYAIEYRFVGDAGFQTLTYAGGNDTSFETAAGPGTDIEWRVAAAFQAEGGPIVTSEPSNIQTTSIPAVQNPGPTGFAAAATALAGSVAVRWTNIDPTATQVRVIARLAGSGDDYSTLTTVAPDRHHVMLTGLTIGVEREFAVVAVGPKGVSDPSNTVTATPTQGFDPAWYKANLDPVAFGVVALTPLVVAVEDDPETLFEDETEIVANETVRGQSFAHQLKVTNPEDRESWSVTNLPPGMDEFDDQLDVVTGTPTEAGLFAATASLTYTGAGTVTAKLVFRVREPFGAPIVIAPLTDRSLGLGSFELNLPDFFEDPDAPKAAKFATSLGDINIALYENVTPQHVQNFLAYVTSGDYNGVAFHRSIPGFVIQAGGFKPVTAPNLFTTVAKRPSPFNEPGMANVRGTIAAAKLGDDPDSATHDFFLNLNDNRVNLDNQNSGFTVFGRITGTGMDVVDAIAAKPRSTYNVVIDGANASFGDWPMNAESAPASMDIAQTVKIESAVEILPLTYTVTGNTNPTAVSAFIQNGVLDLYGLAGGTAEIAITATDLDGQGVTQTFEVTIDGDVINPLLIGVPGDQLLPEGSTATFTVTAQGTDLSYVWRKNGTPLSGEVSSTLQLTNISAADEADYDVVVSNSVKSVTSPSGRLTIARAASITGQPQSVIVRTGTPLVLAATAAGAPTPTASWTKNGTVVTGATNPTLTIASAALADAGVYQLTVTNDGGILETTSNPVDAVVVDATPRTLAVKQGGTTTATVVLAKPAAIELGYLWRRNGVPIVPSNKYSGVTTARLTLRGLGLLDAGIYTCDVIAPNPIGTVLSGNFNVTVASQPQLAEVTLPVAYVGRDFEFVITPPEVTSQTPTRYTATGLPPGVRLEVATGRLHGRPTRAGSFNVRIRAFNPAGGGNTVAATLRVIPMPAPTVGAHTGLLARQATINNNSGGVMTVVVTDNGAFSGNIIVPGARYLVRGTVNRALDGVVTGASAITRTGAAPLAFNFSINPNTGYSTGNLRLDPTTNSEIIGWKNVWHARFNSTQQFGYVPQRVTTGYYTFSMTPPAGGVEIPRGTGFASVTVNFAGRTTVRGRTVDGQPILFNGPLSPNGEFFVYQPLDSNTGSLLGPLRILAVDEDSNGSTELRIRKLENIGFDQFKNVRPASERLYQAGFGSLALTIKGGPYVAPVAPNSRIMGLQELDPDARLRFFDGGLAASVTQPNITFNLNRNNTAVMPELNPGSVTWKVNANTGLFSGRFTLVDGAVRRGVDYFGLLVPVTPTRVNGVGSFQLSQLPGTEQTLSTSPILTGRVDLQPNPPVD